MLFVRINYTGKNDNNV